MEAWKTRSLKDETYVYVYLDATNLKVRMFRKIRKLPVLVALGVRQDGQKEVLAMELLVKESAGAVTGGGPFSYIGAWSHRTIK